MRTRLLALAVLLAGCGQPAGPLLLEGHATLDMQAQPPTQVFEVDLALSAHDAVLFSWRADKETGFNIHSHNGTQVTAYHSTIGLGGNGTFEAPSNGTFSLMWEQWTPEPTRLGYLLRGGGTVLRAGPPASP